MNMERRVEIDGCREYVRDVSSSHRILLAEDDKEMRGLLARVFRKAGYTVDVCNNGWELLWHVEPLLFPVKFGSYDLIVSDIRMPGVSGMEVLEGTRQTKGFPPIILITAFGDDQTHEESKRMGAAAIFDKPFDMDVLLETVKKIITATTTGDRRANGIQNRQ